MNCKHLFIFNLFTVVGLGVLGWQYHLFLHRYVSTDGESLSAKTTYQIDKLSVYNKVTVRYKFIVENQEYFGKFSTTFDEAGKALEYTEVFNKTQKIEVFYNRDNPEENWAKDPYIGSDTSGLFMASIGVLSLLNALCLLNNYYTIQEILEKRKANSEAKSENWSEAKRKADSEANRIHPPADNRPFPPKYDEIFPCVGATAKRKRKRNIYKKNLV